MKTNRWGVFNANDELISSVVCLTRIGAAKKVKFLYPKNYHFVYIKKLWAVNISISSQIQVTI
ncbi:MAG: hypothetical protein M0P47_09280 [Bacteroidales bacterium]|jgi:hypothetical protein|nr:hypothetical protein [Bacteroidales bacterium]